MKTRGIKIIVVKFWPIYRQLILHYQELRLYEVLALNSILLQWDWSATSEDQALEVKFFDSASRVFLLWAFCVNKRTPRGFISCFAFQTITAMMEAVASFRHLSPAFESITSVYVANTPSPWAWGWTPPGAYPQLDLGSGAHSNKTKQNKLRGKNIGPLTNLSSM